MKITEEDKILQFSPICFDASVEQIWNALLNGAGLVLVSKEVISSKIDFNQYLIDKQVTHLDATPSYLEIIELAAGNRIKRVLAGGEVCSVQLAKKFALDYEFYNVFGLTETTVTCIQTLVTFEETTKGKIPIGKPINNALIYILDSKMNLLPKGLIGELFIGGEVLAKGYVNHKSLTDQRFINNPFRPGEKMYRTGDLARWMLDGNIEFYGRGDEQVKIRGFRIELGEIARHISKIDQIQEVLVLAKEIDREKFLVAYYTGEANLPIKTIKNYLKDRLPDYMLPSYYVYLTSFPITSNGKINQNQLPLPRIEVGEDFEAPSNELESKLIAIWADVLLLNPDQISVTKSFFELGGNSIRATILVNKVYITLGIRISLKEFFTCSDIRSLSELLIGLN
jgi:acyl-CoA synthetase (AMP-forming)/AMP-acid ligase II/acyl carrier protein